MLQQIAANLNPSSIFEIIAAGPNRWFSVAEDVLGNVSDRYQRKSFQNDIDAQRNLNLESIMLPVKVGEIDIGITGIHELPSFKRMHHSVITADRGAEMQDKFLENVIGINARYVANNKDIIIDGPTLENGIFNNGLMYFDRDGKVVRTENFIENKGGIEVCMDGSIRLIDPQELKQQMDIPDREAMGVLLTPIALSVDAAIGNLDDQQILLMAQDIASSQDYIYSYNNTFGFLAELLPDGKRQYPNNDKFMAFVTRTSDDLCRQLEDTYQEIQLPVVNAIYQVLYSIRSLYQQSLISASDTVKVVSLEENKKAIPQRKYIRHPVELIFGED